MHAYMPNAGLPSTRSAMSAYFCREFCISLAHEQVVVTCGAAGGLNIIFKALLDPGDEVLCPAPYFVEYGFYADNHGGVLKTAPTTRTSILTWTACKKRSVRAPRSC